METIIKKKLTEKDMQYLFDVTLDKVIVRYYKCISTFSETDKNWYKIRIRHPETVTPEDLKTEIKKLLSRKQ